MSQPVCVVTGAGGALGPAVVREFFEAGFSVRALTRRPADPSLFPPGTEFTVFDILRPETFRQALQGADIVVHMAALLHIVNPPPSLAVEYERINVGGTRNVVLAATSAGVRRVVLFSTIAVYGYGRGSIVDEEVPPRPTSDYGRSKLDAESVVMSCLGADRKPLHTVLRLSAVYGSRVKGNYKRLIDALARGYFVNVGKGQNRRTLLYERDVARAALLAGTHPAAAGEIFNVSDGQFHSVDEIMSAISRALGRRRRGFSVPVGPARVALGLIEDSFRIIGRRSPVGRATVDKFVEDVAVDGSRIMRELGFRPEYGLERGWAETIADMRSRGEI